MRYCDSMHTVVGFIQRVFIDLTANSISYSQLSYFLDKTLYINPNSWWTITGLTLPRAFNREELTLAYVGNVFTQRPHESINIESLWRAAATKNTTTKTDEIKRLTSSCLTPRPRIPTLGTFLSASAELPEQNGTCSGSASQTSDSDPTYWMCFLNVQPSFKVSGGFKRLKLGCLWNPLPLLLLSPPSPPLLGGSYCIQPASCGPSGSGAALHPPLGSLAAVLSPKHHLDASLFCVYTIHTHTAAHWCFAKPHATGCCVSV